MVGPPASFVPAAADVGGRHATFLPPRGGVVAPKLGVCPRVLPASVTRRLVAREGSAALPRRVSWYVGFHLVLSTAPGIARPRIEPCELLGCRWQFAAVLGWGVGCTACRLLKMRCCGRGVAGRQAVLPKMCCPTLIELERSIFQLGCSSVSPAASSSSDVPGFLPARSTGWGAASTCYVASCSA